MQLDGAAAASSQAAAAHAAAQTALAALPRLPALLQPPHLPVAAVVPEFPRIGGQVVRDWIGAATEQLSGFSGDDITRLLFPDLVGLVDGPTLLISCTLALALVYWEGGVLLRALRERQAAEAARRRQEREARRRERGGGIFGSWDSPAGGADESSEGGSSSSQHGTGAWDARGWEDWGPEPPPGALPPEPTRVERARFERRRSLGYLALVTTVLIWMTGVVSGPSPFQP
ncbi:hypothetical protein ABPG77_004201 [Micractinium sp. CCAP 211/92]